MTPAAKSGSCLRSEVLSARGPRRCPHCSRGEAVTAAGWRDTGRLSSVTGGLAVGRPRGAPESRDFVLGDSLSSPRRQSGSSHCRHRGDAEEGRRLWPCRGPSSGRNGLSAAVAGAARPVATRLPVPAWLALGAKPLGVQGPPVGAGRRPRAGPVGNGRVRVCRNVPCSRTAGTEGGNPVGNTELASPRRDSGCQGDAAA